MPGKRKLPNFNAIKKGGKKRKHEVELSSEESDDDFMWKKKNDAEDEEEEKKEEELEEKKLRLVKERLKLEALKAEEEAEEEDVDDVLSKRLRDQRLEKEGRLYKMVADSCQAPGLGDVDVLTSRWLTRSVTCVAVSPDGKFAFSGSKDCAIMKWCLETKQKVLMVLRAGVKKSTTGHKSKVLALALSSDGKYLASGDEGKRIHIWQAATLQLYHIFSGHRGPVTGLAFRRGSYDLFSCSADRSLKQWDAENKAYVDTLYGHEDGVTDIDCLTKEQIMSSGGRDRTARRWQLVEAKQAVFRAPPGSLDCISFMDESHFVTGSDQNAISVWSFRKKHPLVTVRAAHGEGEHWITAVKALPFSDLVASGSNDGHIKIWKSHQNFEKLTLLFTVPVSGCVNSLQFSPDGSKLVAGVGKEVRLGRWLQMKEVRNAVHIIPLNRRESDSDSGGGKVQRSM